VILLRHEQSVRPWKTDEVWLLPPSVADFVPAGHPGHPVRDLVGEVLDLSAIMDAYTEVKGYPPYHPAMMVALLLDAYRSGVVAPHRAGLRGATGFSGRDGAEPA
jgi:transposase